MNQTSISCLYWLGSFLFGTGQGYFTLPNTKNEEFAENGSGGRLPTPEIFGIPEKIQIRKQAPLAEFHTSKLSENLKIRGFVSVS